MTQDWNALAGTFDDEPDHGLRDPGVRRAWWSLLEPLLPPAPARIADLGCGTGSLTLLLTDHGHEVTGLDQAPAMLERARSKLGGRASLVQGDAAHPPLPAAAFDVVLARHILFALPEPEAVVGRWVRLLAPGGGFCSWRASGRRASDSAPRRCGSSCCSIERRPPSSG
ncbi:class I SAM-dependent methyltransferase [Naasia aerilata]|uniref:Methyltransferase type 11 domain-containing protein n=1 Tax=Naasia aerilata TaxID=1162966 RepID=A0ABM8GCR7_9MICO|nr:class I SAM-dependent methyltransferase [Naasia aerilata]BDZ46033.1 hypothetical protein GCM10025866_19420 [Naasia aerilata]